MWNIIAPRADSTRSGAGRDEVGKKKQNINKI
jgi:hypothetical protein